MLIGIHAKALTERNPTGVAEYARQIFLRIASLSEATRHRFLFYVDGEFSPPLNVRGGGEGLLHNSPNAPSYLKRGISRKILRFPIVWTQGRLAWELALRKPDVFFTPQHVLPVTSPKRSVVTIHGLEFEKFPQFYSLASRAYLRWVTKDAVRRVAHIIAVSEATKRDLMELYGVADGKITVIYHGVSTPDYRLQITDYRNSEKFSTARPTERHQSFGRGSNNKILFERSGAESRSIPYFLYLGRIEKKKNVDGIIRAFEIAKAKYKLPHKLILAGGDGYGSANIKYLISNIKYRDQIQIIGYISEEEKLKLLAHAEALVFPSWYEGFGLPILEAQAVGVPVITSNVSAMPEVAGDAALLIDPTDPESIAEAMQNVATNETLRKDLVAKGYENIKRFSW